MGKQGSKNAGASQEQSLLLPSRSRGTPRHGSHCGVTVRPRLHFPVLGTADSKAGGPSRARPPPNEGQRHSSMQGGAQPGEVPAEGSCWHSFQPKSSANPAVQRLHGRQCQRPRCAQRCRGPASPAVLGFAKRCSEQTLTSGCSHVGRTGLQPSA